MAATVVNWSFNHDHDESDPRSKSFLDTQPIVNAVHTAFRLMNDPAARFNLFGSACALILEGEVDNVIQDCISEAVAYPYELIVAPLNGSIMQVTPNIGEGPGSHLVRFSTTFTSCSDNPLALKRCEFLHIVKILHEVAHTLTPALVRRTDAYRKAKAAADSAGAPFPSVDTPDRIGQVWTSKGGVMSDFGSAFEQTVFGGRVITGKDVGDRYAKPLKLIAVSNARDAPRQGTFREFVISDERVLEILTALEHWLPGSPLPDLHLALESSEAGECADQGLALKKTRKAALVYGGVTSCTEGQEEAPDTEDEEGDQASTVGGPRPTQEELEALRALGQVLNEDQVRFIKSGKGKL